MTSSAVATLVPPLALPARSEDRRFAGAPDDKARLDAICDRSPAIAALAGHVREFANMMRKLTGRNLPQWIKQVEADPCPACTPSPTA